MKAHAHLTDKERESIVRRLGRIEGQVRGIQRMVEEGERCNDILTQVSAATTALDRVGLRLLDGYVHGCVREGTLRGGKAAEVEGANLLDAVERFVRMR